jgi:protein-tyrosine phosphatase
MRKKVRVLFVCLGNICRSPTAQGVFQKLIEEHGLSDWIVADSAGTHAYHVGEPPDQRAQQAASKRGVDLSPLRARRAIEQDFEVHDYVLAMDYANYEYLQSICPPGQEHKLKLFMQFAPDLEIEEVPDPYYGGASGFERVMDMVEEAARGLIAEIQARRQL